MTSTDTNAPIESWLAHVHGRVQGVGYREACVHRARSLGVTGWVRNRTDGSVEVLLQGRSEQLAQMRRWLHDGLPAAIVDEVKVARMQPPFTRFDRFDRLPTE